MFAITFDLDIAVVNRQHPAKNQGAYKDIRLLLEEFGFRKVQGSTYVADHEDQTQLFLALTALRRQVWLGPSLKNLRVFRMEQGADFTTIMKTPI